MEGSIYSASWESNRASTTAFYDDVATVSPASFTDLDAESAVDIISNEEQDTRACEGIEDDTILMHVDDEVESEEEAGFGDEIDKPETAQNKNKVCPPRVF
jgi:hypothetical protein